MRYSFFVYLFLFLLQASLALAEVGTECMETGDCEAGEFCIAKLDGTGKFCTRRCGNNPCPDGFSCQEKNGLMLCDYGYTEQFGGMGEPCTSGCEGNLFCVNDPNGNAMDAYCSRGCTGAGSCPSGFYCNLVQSDNEPRICAKQNQLPAYGEPCQNMQCAEGYTCITSPERALPYCSSSCENRPCINGLTCGADQQCHHQPIIKPGIGEACINDSSAQEQGLIGCEGDLECFSRSKFTFCTQACNRVTPCPDGMGCVYRSGMVELGVDGICTPYEPDSSGLERPNTESAGMTSGGNQTSNSNGGKTTSTTTEESTQSSSGCQQGQQAQLLLFALLLLMVSLSHGIFKKTIGLSK